MFRWICGVTRKNIIRHKLISGSYSNRVASIVDKTRENGLRWFGHVTKRDDSAGSESGYGNECRRNEREVKTEEETDKQNRE